MRIAIVGAGGVGGGYGAALAKAGADVTFIARGAHLAAMKSTGLKVLSPRGDTHLVPTQATDNPAEIGKVDFVLFCVKLWDIESAGERIKPLIGAGYGCDPAAKWHRAHERLIPILGSSAVMCGVAQIIRFDHGARHDHTGRRLHADGFWRTRWPEEQASRGFSGAVPEGGV